MEINTTSNYSVASGTEPPNRCRLLLVIDASGVTPEQFQNALDGGDVASVIIHDGGLDQNAFMQACEKLVAASASTDVACLVANDSQAAGRAKADGLFVDSGLDDSAEAIARFSPQKIVGCGGIKDRHRALQFGDLQPDFIFLGKLKGDIKPEPHPKNIALAQWWSQMIEIPCVIMGGNSVESVVACAESGAEFVALSTAVFGGGDMKGQVTLANRLLDEHAPQFVEAE